MHLPIFKQTLLTLLLAAGLTACGGGSGDSGQKESDSTSTAPPVNSANDRVKTALSTGDVSALTAEDQKTLLQMALAASQEQQRWQKELLTGLYTDLNQQMIQPYLQFIPSASLNIYPTDFSTSLPIAVSDINCNWALELQNNKGCGLGVASKIGKGRTLAYGQNMFTGILNNNADFTQFTEVLNNSLRWLLTGNTRQEVKPEIKVTVQGMPADPVKNYLEKHLNTAVVFPQCNALDPENTCWEDIDLMVISSNIGGQKFEKELIQKYLNAGKSIYFQAHTGSTNSNIDKVLSAMNMQTNNNYYRNKDGILLSNKLTVQQRWDQINQIDATIQVLKYFIDPHTVNLGDLTADNPLIQGIRNLSSSLQRINNQGMSAFSDQNSNEALKALVLIADLWRPAVNYNTLNKNGDVQAFMQAYASDAWIDYKRKTTTTSATGAGDYMPAEAQHMPVSSDWETITVTIPQGSGVTAIGRASIPAKAVEVQIVDAQDANLAIQTSHIRAWGNPFDNSGYKRPLRPNSYSIKLVPQQDNAFISPFGGPLMLNYNNAQAGSTVTLKIKGSAKYAHYDFTQPMTQTEKDQATQVLQSKAFGWNTFKFVGGEIQQTNAYALKVIGNLNPDVYIDRIKTVIYDSNHIANGYNNMPLDSSTQQYCSTLGWDCTSDVHRAPNVQHFVGWIATCGFLCSGNPSDGSTGLDIGWGWVHELGHNTVQEVLTMTFPSTETKNTIGCGTECNNNILAGLSMLRKNEIYGLDSNGSNFHHPRLYSVIQANRNTGLSGEALRVDMEKRLWQGDDNAQQAFHMQLAHNYTKLHQAKAKPDSQGVFEFMRLLNISQRLYYRIDLSKATAAEKNKLGLGAYSSKNNISRPDMIYLLSSKIMGYDLKNLFTLYGIPVSDTAHSSIAMLGLTVAPLSFYAQKLDRSNFLNEGTWVNIPTTGAVANYPY